MRLSAGGERQGDPIGRGSGKPDLRTAFRGDALDARAVARPRDIDGRADQFAPRRRSPAGVTRVSSGCVFAKA